MDREISKTTQNKRKRKKWLGVGILLVVIAASLFAFRSVLTTEVERSKLRIATVGQGTIEQTLTASGEVFPEFEQRLISPIQARIESVMLPVGSVAEANQPILLLNKELALTQRKQLLNEWKLAQSNYTQLKNQLEQGIFDLNTNLSIKQLRVKQLKKSLDDTKHLQKIGGKTEQEVEQAQLNWEIAKLEEAQLQHDLSTKKRNRQADLDAQAIQVTMKKESLADLDEKLEKAKVSSDRKGIVTWLNEQIGSMVQANDEIARIADLSSFRVIGTIAASHAGKLSSGMTTIVKANDQELRGVIVNIQPEVKNNTIKFTVALNEKSHATLRPNMRVQVYVVTASKSNTLTIANGAAFSGKVYQDVFVLNGDQLERRQVKVGLSNFDEVELLENAKVGDQLVISGLQNYEHLEVIKLK